MKIIRRVLACSLVLLTLGVAGMAGAQFLSGVAGAAGVIGSCATSNAVTKWTASTTIGCSAIIDTTGVLTGVLSTTIEGTAGAGFVQLANQSSAPSTPTTSSRLYVDASNRLSWKGTNGFIRTFDGTANSADRVYVLPDAAGTVALTANKLSAFAATTSAELAGVISDETGTGALVFGTSPTFTTGITAALHLGGTAAGSSLTLQSTSGAGTTDVINLKVGNNGAVTGLAIATTGAATFGSSVTVTTRTGTAAAFACFDSGGKLVEKATACQ